MDSPTAGSSLLKRSLKGLTVVFSVTSFRTVGNLVVQMILARLLAPEDFGVIAFAMTMVGLFALLSNVQGQKAIIRSHDEEVIDVVDVAFTIELALGLVTGLLFLFTMPVFLRLLGKVEVIPYARALTLSLICRPLLMPKAWFERELDFSRANLPSVVGIGANVLVAVSLGLGGYGAWSIAGGILAKDIAQCVVLWRIVPYRPRLRWDALVASEVLSFGLPLTGAAVVAYFYWNVDDFLVGKIAGNEKLGYYWLAFKFPHYILAAQRALNSVIFSAFSRAKDNAQLLRGFNLATRASAFVLLPLCGIALALGEPTIRYFFGIGWLPATFSFQVFMVLVTIRGIVAHWTPVMTVKGETVFQFKVIVLNAVVLLLLGYPLLRCCDFNGMAVAVLLTICFSLVFMVRKLKSLLNVNYISLLARPVFAFLLTWGIMSVAVRHPEALSLWEYIVAVIGDGLLFVFLLYLVDRPSLLEFSSILRQYGLHSASR